MPMARSVMVAPPTTCVVVTIFRLPVRLPRLATPTVPELMVISLRLRPSANVTWRAGVLMPVLTDMSMARPSVLIWRMAAALSVTALSKPCRLALPDA